MDKLEQDLRNGIRGDIHFDPISLRAYSVDASIFEIEPIGIVLPKTKQDLINAIKIAFSHQIPVIPRGAATGITGGCIGKGLIIDTSKYLTSIIKIDYDQQYAICEPGVVQDDLNAALSPKGLRLGPDTSTGNRATLGGMAANNAAGARSLRYGKMVDHVEKIEMVLADGSLITFQAITDEEWTTKRQQDGPEGNIYREIYRVVQSCRQEIIDHFPKIPRRVSGYNLDELIKSGPINLAKLVVGSEGTLGVITEITVKLSLKPKATGLCLLQFDDMIAAMHWVPQLLTYQPLSLEMIDETIIKLGRQSPSMRGKMDWLLGEPKAVFAVEFDADTPAKVEQKLIAFTNEARKAGIGYAQLYLTQPAQLEQVWSLRKAGLGILMSKRSYSRAVAFLEDISVAPENLASFMEKFCLILKRKGKEAGIYGHVGSGCMHVRPFLDLRQPEELSLMNELMQSISSLLLEYGGALSGEHGDGIIRSWLNPKMFGEKIYQAFVAIKAAFDPHNLMNPGKIVHPTDHLKNLRTAPDSKVYNPATFLDFTKEGGFALAVDMCNGNGLCRKKEGVMCPSFQVDNDEYHSTRARAQALRAIIHGNLAVNNFTNQDVYDVLDLCISCKGCKTECPSQVDMAKMKAEFLYQYQEARGYSLRTRLFGHIGQINQFFSPIASLFNRIASTHFAKWMQQCFGIAKERTLPALAQERLSHWFKKYRQPDEATKLVVLFNDTFTEFNHPEIGQAAIKILNQLGYRVIMPEWRCCGRPFISKGMLKQAKKGANKLIQDLYPYAAQGLPIIGLEPSCLLTIKDDFADMINGNALNLEMAVQDNEVMQSFELESLPMGIDHSQKVKATSIGSDYSSKDCVNLSSSTAVSRLNLVKGCCTTFDEFLSQVVEEGLFNLSFKNEKKQVRLHGHCHQKALVGTKPTMNVLKAIPGFEVTEIHSGCCGMAGSFGYEQEHYEFSMKIGNTTLFPAIEACPENTIIVANGMSCRSQIIDGTGRHAKHLAEVIFEAIQTS